MFEALAHWLKTTIPGIVVLGAAGSIVALMLMRMLRPVPAYLFTALLTIEAKLTLSWVTYSVRSAGQVAYLKGYFEGARNWYGLGTLILYILVKLIIMVAGASVTLVLFAFYAQQKPVPVGVLFNLSIFFFICSFTVLRVFLVVWLEYSQSVRPVELKAAANAKETVTSKMVSEALQGKSPGKTPEQGGPPEA